MTATGFEFLLLGLLLGAGLGFLAGRNRAALSALAQARLDGAQSIAARELTERQRAIEELVDPLQDALNRVWGEYFGDAKPTTTTVQVVRLATDPRCLVEINAIAVID